MDPITLTLLLAAAGAGLGAVKGATDGKKGNLLSSMLIGGGLGAAGGAGIGFLGPALAGGAGAGAAGSAAAALPQVAGAASSTAAGLTPATSSALGSMMSAGNVAGAGFNLPTVGASAAKAAPSMFSKLGSFASSPAGKAMFKSIGQSQPQQEMPNYLEDYGIPVAQNVPYMMPQNQYIGKQASLPQIPQRRFA